MVISLPIRKGLNKHFTQVKQCELVDPRRYRRGRLSRSLIQIHLVLMFNVPGEALTDVKEHKRTLGHSHLQMIECESTRVHCKSYVLLEIYVKADWVGDHPVWRC
jgi:hypothetical protein